MAAIKTKYGYQIMEQESEVFEFDGIWREVMGTPPVTGFWIVYGNEKQGKTSFSLWLAEYLSKFDRVLYVSAEQGIGSSFKYSFDKAKANPRNRKVRYAEYLPIVELQEYLDSRKSHNIIIIDNITRYDTELDREKIMELKQKYENKKLIIFISHEESNEPDRASGRLIKKLAEIIIRVEGLACEVSGRCPKGTLLIDEEKAQLYHGTQITEQNN
ncbi:hypothetical protein [Ornithobacterium rhinotracheale]